MTTLDLQLRPALAAHVRLKVDPINGDPLLLFPEGVFVLNHTAHEIVRYCDGNRNIAKLLEILAEEFEVQEDVMLADVLEILHELQRRNLILLSA